MAITTEQARARALQLRSDRPELQNMAIDDLIAQIIATEGQGAPGAGGNLANIFQPARVITPSSPAPMQPAQLQAPKPTADMVPGADAYRRAQEVRDFTAQPATPDERAAANSRVQALIAELPTGTVERAPEAAAAAPVALAAAPAEKAPEKPKYVSRFRPQFEQAKAELDQLKAAVPSGAAAPPELVSKITNLSGVVARLQGLVAAEEGAVVDAERAALLERQTARLGREEELVEQARKRAPFDALIAGGAALAGAKPGESFASALTRGLQAGSEKYTGARDAREAALRGIEEKRDAYALQKMDALQAARDKAIALSDAGVKLSQEGYAMSKLSNDDIVALSTRDDVIKTSRATASKAETEALLAPETIRTENDLKAAQAAYYRLGGGRGSSGGSGDKPMTQNQIQTKIGDLSKERRGLMITLNSATTVGAEKAAIKLAIAYIDRELGELRGTRSPAAPATAAKPAGKIVSSKPLK
jgi:hypothetical protein